MFMSPPWGGPAYSKVKKFDINTMLKPREGYIMPSLFNDLSLPAFSLFLKTDANMFLVFCKLGNFSSMLERELLPRLSCFSQEMLI